MGIETALLVASAAVGTIGAIQTANANSRQADAEANADRYNQQIASQNAAIARQQTAQQLDQQKRETFLRMGAARAAAYASGVTIEGSPLDVLQMSASNAALDAENIKYQGKLKELGYQNTADQYGYQASNRNSGASALLAGASSVASGAVNVYKAGKALQVK